MPFRSKTDLPFSGGGSQSITKPAGTAENDLLLLVWSKDPSGGTATLPSGFTLLSGFSTDGLAWGSDGANTGVAYKVAGASEPATYPIIFENVDFGCCLSMLAFSGISTTAPINVVGTVQTNGGTAAASPYSFAAPSITTTVAGCELVHVAAIDSANAAAMTGFTPPAGYTERTEVIDANYSGLAVSTVTQGSAGATGIITSTGTGSAAMGRLAVLVALAPVASGGSPYTLSAEQGTYILTGQATLAKRVMGGGQGSYALTGQDATLSKSGGAYSLTADVGLYTLFGSEAQRDVSMNAEQGTFALTGTAANMLRAYRMTAAQASFVLTGRAATLSYSANPAPEVPPVSTGGGGPLKSAYVYVVSATGRAKWVDYIPVRQVVPGSGATNTFANDGAIGVTMLANVTGLREWVDYIPVVEVADSVNRWRQENDGWIPIVAL